MPSPIALFAYNRLDYLQQTVRALANNELASESDLYVFCDGSKTQATESEKQAVHEVQHYAHTLEGFKSVSVIVNPQNKGLADSIVQGVYLVLSRSETVIVLEDDIVTSPYFLRYMNDALEKYRKVQEVISIHGYCYPAQFPRQIKETFFLKGADCWGWATWRRGWKLFNPDARELIRQLEASGAQKEFDFGGTFHYMDMLHKTAETNHSWAVKWYASAFLNQKLTLYPKHSLVVNIGAVGANSNEENMHRFGKATHDTRITYFESKLKENKVAKRAIQNYFSGKQGAGLWRGAGRTVKKALKYLLSWAFKPSVAKECVYWQGNYPSYEAALAKSTGYNAMTILEKVKQGALKVKKGEAAYEQDSVTFETPSYNEPLVDALKMIAGKIQAPLHVLDFGGSLGSTYFQHKARWTELQGLQWSIVEQEHFVTFGRQQLEDVQLKFYYTLAEALSRGPVHVVLFSSVLQYLPSYEAILNEVKNAGIPYVVLDRTAVAKDKAFWSVQTVHEPIYEASYPAYFFTREELLNIFAPQYSLKYTFDSGITDSRLIERQNCQWTGMVMEYRPA